MSMTNGPAFNLIAGHPVLDFVNTLDNRFAPGGPKELLMQFEDLLRFSVQSGLITQEHADRLVNCETRAALKNELTLARRLREALAGVLYRIVDARPNARKGSESRGLSYMDMENLNMTFRISRSLQRLAWVDGKENTRMVWEWDLSQADVPLHLLLGLAADFLVSDELELMRKCESPTCQWLFLARGKKNKARRWCEMKVCGNRMKARRHYSRVRERA